MSINYNQYINLSIMDIPITHQNLVCPISLTYFVEPIMTPCCGNAISKPCISEWLDKSTTCPICRVDISGFNVNSVPILKNIASMIEDILKPQNPIIELKQEWTAKIYPICNNNVSLSTIGKLEIKNNNINSNFKTLLIPTIDKSGSMAGSAFNQVKYSLNRIVDLTYSHSQLITNLVSYCDSASTVEINTTQPQNYYGNIVQTMNAGGGTRFKSAFDEIIKICKKYKDDNLVSSIVIIFLTDGMDSGVTSVNGRNDLVNELKTNIELIWKKSYTIHTIGFTSDHDDAFLNSLRVIGTNEGAYRYANPSEDTDCISSKINSILDVIAVSTTIPIKLLPMPNLSILFNENGKFWLNMTNVQLGNNIPILISIDNGEPMEIIAEIAEEANDLEVCNQWYSILIDQIATELIILSNQMDLTLDKQLHCEILQQRSRAIKVRLDSTSNNYLRLEKLVETLNLIQIGEKVDQRKLNDAKFEGQFQTKSSNAPQQIAYTTSNTTYQQVPQQKYYSNYRSWDTVNKPAIKRCNANNKSDEIFRVIGHYTTSNACDWMRDNANYNSNIKDSNGANALIVASSIGRVDIVRELIGYFDINETNNLGYNAIDMAALFGYWITFEILAENSAVPTISGDVLLKTCISNKYYNLADRLIKNNFANLTEDMENSAPTGEAVSWINSKVQKEIPLETAILKGMYDEVLNKLHNIDTISWKPFMEIFVKSTNNHVKIVELLLKNNKADANEIMDDTSDPTTKEIIWPLFIACEKGNLSMVKLLLKYSNLNQQNLKGTTALWIACCNKHVDIVMELLQAGADPNLANLKGDSPLIPCCQKGADSIVEILLEAGINIDSYNKNRDGPVLICCRTGQSKILEILLKRFSQENLKLILETYAEIDGFVPLLAATELDKVECIKICVKYGANLEERSQPDNQIISGATAVHLAAYYGRVSALNVLHNLGANFSSQTVTHGYTPLHIAIKQGHKDAIRFILNLDVGKACLQTRDNDNRLPIYYANKEGNENILEEFFTNKLEKILNKVMFSDEHVESACSDILVKYGQSIGCYEYNEITNITGNSGSSLLSNAILSGNNNLVNTIINMGADLHKKDDYGLTPMFWKIYLNQTGLNTMEIPDDTKQILHKIINVGKKSMQNKLLLNLKVENLQNLPLLENGNNLLNKMKDGYSLKVHNNVLAKLKESNFEEHSLVGFVEKLKNNKVFPEGKDCLEYIIWNAKIHLIKMIAAGEDNLNVIHILALYLYSSNTTIFENVNMSMANFKENNLWNPFVFTLYQAVNLLPVYEGEVYRGVNMLFDINVLALGKVIKWDTFAICSRDYAGTTELINLKKGIIFVINSKSGKDISKYSKNPVDAEIIFCPGTSMKITNYYSASMICLGQANIRNSTFSIKDTDLVKAARGEACIIVELDEVL